MKVLGITLALLLFCGTSLADQQEKDSGEDTQQARFQKFEREMSGVKLVGQFTIVGREDREPSQEEYTIRSVSKADRGDYWLFTARIKYGDKDYEVPLPLEVKWAGDTPVITLTDLQILGQGPFSARVVLHANKYAGTWSHGKVHGHLFGKIVERSSDTGQ